MLILVLNSGSSSLKYQLLQRPGERLIRSNWINKIGEPGSTCFFESLTKLSLEKEAECPNHEKVNQNNVLRQLALFLIKVKTSIIFQSLRS